MGFFKGSVRSALSAAMLAVMLLALFAPTVCANTYNLTAPNRPAICSGNQGSWDGSTYVCTWDRPLTLNPGDVVLSNGPITILSQNGINVTNVTFGGNGNNINLRAGGSNNIQLNNSTLFGSITNTPRAQLEDGSVVHGTINTSSTVIVNDSTVHDSVFSGAPLTASNATFNSNVTSNSSLTIHNSEVTGTTSSANAFTATNTVFGNNVTSGGALTITNAEISGNLQAANAMNLIDVNVSGTTTSTNGLINISGGDFSGLVRSNCCKVTIESAAVIRAGVTAGNNGIEISDSSVDGNLTAANNPIVLTNVAMTSGDISAGQNNVTITGGIINANIPNAHRIFVYDGAQINGDLKARFEVNLNSSVVVGNVETTADHDGLHHVYMTDSFVYGNVIVRSDWGTITGNWPDSAIYGDCEYNTVTPNLCSAAPPPDPPSFCDEITAATGFGIVGESGFNYGSNSYINNNTIDGTGNTPTPVGQVDTVALNFPALDPATFPIFTASTNISSTTINPGTYNNVTLTGNNSYLMTGGTYFIKTLRFSPSGNNNTLTMQAGDYFIEDFRLGNGAEIITSGGPVRIFIRNFMRSANNDNQAPNQLRINSSGNVAHFQVYLYNGASINFGNGNQGNSTSEQINFNGIIYGPFANNNVTFGNNNNIQASILVGGTVTVGNNTDFNYSSEVEAAINAAYGCDDDDPDLFCTIDTFSSASGFDTLWRTSRSQGDFFPQVVNGRLRLTEREPFQATLASLLRSFPAANNYIKVEFDYFAYGGANTGADGMALVFSDATKAPIPGGPGGSLGYAQRFGIPGFNGGWLGVGLDSFGNFSNASDGNKTGGISGDNSARRNRVVLRGAEATSYQYITASQQLNPTLYTNSPTPNFGHRYRVTIDSRTANQSLIEVTRDTSGLGTFEPGNTEVLIPEFNVYNVAGQQPAVPDNFIISFAAATGNVNNIHEIDNVEICAINSSPIGTAVDHYRVYHPRDNVSCFTAPIEVIACANDNCSSKYTSPVEYQINSSLGNNATWQGQDITSSGAGSALLSVVNAETQLGLTHLPAGTASLSITNSAPPTIGPTRCFDITAPTQTTNCQIEFTTAGLVIGGATLGDPAPNAYSGDPFTNYLWAIETNTTTGACEARVQGEQTVSFGVECLNPAQCSSGIDYQINSSAIGKANGNATIQYADATVEFDASGRAALSNVYPDVGLFRLHAELTLAEEPSAADPDINDPAVTLTGISLNDYVLRPYRLAVAPVDTNGNPVAATTDSGAGFQAAGSEFAAIVQGQNPDGSATPNFGNESPMAQVAADVSSVIFPDGGELGTLAGLTGFVKSTSIPGAFINEGLSWNEAGTLGLIASLVNDDYLGAGDAFEKPVSPVGRFYPDRFELVSSSVGETSLLCSAGFIYMGHDNIYAEFSLQAVNVHGDITTNYGKTANSGPDYVGSAAANLVAASNNPQDTATDEFATRFVAAVAPAWNDGVMAVTLDNLTFARLSSNAPDGPFPVVTIGVQLSGEQDNRNFAAFNLSSQSGDAVALNGSLDIRYGRMVLENITGPSNEDLAIDLRAQYWNGNQFITNTDDNCTEFWVDNLNIINNPDILNTTADGTDGELVSGRVPFSELFWRAPTPTDTTGEFEFEYEAPPWLQFDWFDADSFPHDNPRAFGTFGQYRGNDRIIFWLELR